MYWVIKDRSDGFYLQENPSREFIGWWLPSQRGAHKFTSIREAQSAARDYYAKSIRPMRVRQKGDPK
jgi:hypothetical protein